MILGYFTVIFRHKDMTWKVENLSGWLTFPKTHAKQLNLQLVVGLNRMLDDRAEFFSVL